MARHIAAAVREAGGRALIVGGWVRDRLRPSTGSGRPELVEGRGHSSKDIDLEIFGIPQHRLAALLAPFGRVEAVGQSFPVYKVIGKETGDRRQEAGGRRQEAVTHVNQSCNKWRKIES